MKKFDVDKYFRKNPAPRFPGIGEYHGAVIIPAYDESADIDRTLDSLQAARCRSPHPVAAAVVINYPPGADTEQSEELRRQIDSGKWDNVTAIWLPDNPGGVGLARKTGMDSFLSSVSPENMENTVLFSLDADTVIEEDYFSVLFPEVLAGGAVSIPFSHQKGATPQLQKAIDCYEAYMARYVQKLAFAGSPYAFHTIGSAFAVRGDAYIRAGGMKVKHAGEDFYFLQAVAKSSKVRELSGDPLVHPSPRPSNRVPFGTGPAVASLLSGKTLSEIPDEAFDELKIFLDLIRTPGILNRIETLRNNLPENTMVFLRKEGFFTAWEKILEHLQKSEEKRRQAFHEWFDGLKTLKFLHFFSDLRNFDIDKKLFKC